MKSKYLSNQYLEILSSHHLNSFESVWACAIQWFEEPNERRGGWSGVGRIDLDAGRLTSISLFVKKQQNHGRLTFLHPLKGEPTFRREFRNLKFLEKKSFGAPEVVFYAESEDEKKAALITVALDGYLSMDEVLTGWWSQAESNKKSLLLKKIALELRRFHGYGLVHRALYPKHIFVKDMDESPQVALIDLEKARFTLFPPYRTFFDLSALNRHTEKLSLTERLRFLKWYLGVKKLGVFNKFLCRLILKRAYR